MTAPNRSALSKALQNYRLQRHAAAGAGWGDFEGLENPLAPTGDEALAAARGAVNGVLWGAILWAAILWIWL